MKTYGEMYKINETKYKLVSLIESINDIPPKFLFPVMALDLTNFDPMPEIGQIYDTTTQTFAGYETVVDVKDIRDKIDLLSQKTLPYLYSFIVNKFADDPLMSSELLNSGNEIATLLISLE